jgi:Uma2 family endonuclease
MEATVTERKTVQDYLQLAEGAPFQLLNGKLIMSPARNRKHQQLIGLLYRLIADYVEKNNSGEVYFAPFDVYLDDDNVVQPDICFFSKNRLHLLGDRGAEAAPDLVVELLSPSNAYYDLRYKLELYERFGVAEYFIADPEDNTVMAYLLINGKYKEQYREKGIMNSGVLAANFNW